MKSKNFGKNSLLQYSLLSKLLCIFLSLAVGTVFSLPAAVAQESQEQQEVSEEQIEEFKEVKKAAKKEKVAEAVQENPTGNDPRAFANQWMPFYRYTELENGLIQQDVTAFGTFGFSPRVGMYYEVPLAQYRDFSDVPGFPADADSDALGMGNIDLKFLWRPAATEFTYGKEGKKSASVLFGTDFVLPTATNAALGGDAFVFAPILGIVFDMPLYAFVASLNLYYFDVYKEDSAPKTSRYVGRWFYMQPLTPPGKWWGGFFLMPEFQPIYDFETEDFSSWLGVELGKIVGTGKVAYIKPGWGLDNSEETDRKSTLEFGFRWFF